VNFHTTESGSFEKEMSSAIDKISFHISINKGETVLLKENFKVSPSQASAIVLLCSLINTYNGQN